MVRVYKYLFFRAYDLIQVTGDYDLAWGASHFLSLFFSLLVLNLMLFFQLKIEWQILGFTGVFVLVVFHLINYSLFLKGKKYKILVENYKKEQNKERIIGRLISFAMVLGLIYSLF